MASSAAWMGVNSRGGRMSGGSNIKIKVILISFCYGYDWGNYIVGIDFIVILVAFSNP